jgi:hypothetical protein
MKCNLPPKVVGRSGMTLIELTVIIVVLLLLISVMFIGGTAWKRGSDRAGCVLNLRNVQVAARSYQNLYGYNFGGRPYAENGTQDIARHLLDKGYIERKLYDQAKGAEPCPSGGTYSCAAPDIFPQAGELYLKCSLSETYDHVPKEGSYSDW